MTKADSPVLAWQDVPAAIGLLTRLPVAVDTDHAQARGAAAAWAYPLVGVLVGVLLVVLAWIAMGIGLPPAVAAMLVLICGVIVTGALHEDGLSDSVDGLWGGWDRARRLEIMKDSRIGAYGVLALILILGLKAMCLALLLDTPLWTAALVLPATFSRAAMVVVMHRMPHARDGGLSRAVGRPAALPTGIAIGIAVLTVLVIAGGSTWMALVIAAIFTQVCMTIARRKIGGQTGDILGATQQLTEVALLVYLTTQIT